MLKILVLALVAAPMTIGVINPTYGGEPAPTIQLASSISSSDPSVEKPDSPLSSDELNVLFSEYSGRYKDKFADAVNTAFEGESRNDVWASAVEAEVKRTGGTNPQILIEGGECRASLCRYVLAPSEEGTAKNFGRTLVNVSKTTRHPIDVCWKHDAKTNNYTMYLFSLASPADWVAELK